MAVVATPVIVEATIVARRTPAEWAVRLVGHLRHEVQLRTSPAVLVIKNAMERVDLQPHGATVAAAVVVAEVEVVAVAAREDSDRLETGARTELATIAIEYDFVSV